MMRLAMHPWFLLLISALFVYAGGNDTAVTPQRDTSALATVPVQGAGDSLQKPQPALSDSGSGVSSDIPAGDAAAVGSSTKVPPTQSSAAAQPQPESLKLVKRTYNRRLVALATGMMIFVVAIMTAAQQWNPR